MTTYKGVIFDAIVDVSQSAEQRYKVRIGIEPIPMFGADSLSHFIYLDFMCTV
jgi:hypothetical protein